MVKNPPAGPRKDRTQVRTGRQSSVPLVIFLNNDMECVGKTDLEKMQGFILSHSKGVWALDKMGQELQPQVGKKSSLALSQY